MSPEKPNSKHTGKAAEAVNFYMMKEERYETMEKQKKEAVFQISRYKSGLVSGDLDSSALKRLGKKYSKSASP